MSTTSQINVYILTQITPFSEQTLLNAVFYDNVIFGTHCRFGFANIWTRYQYLLSVVNSHQFNQLFAEKDLQMQIFTDNCYFWDTL